MNTYFLLYKDNSNGEYFKETYQKKQEMIDRLTFLLGLGIPSKDITIIFGTEGYKTYGVEFPL